LILVFSPAVMVGRSLVLLETQTDINIYRSDWLSVTDGDFVSLHVDSHG